jgi:hypothetical protein
VARAFRTAYTLLTTLIEVDPDACFTSYFSTTFLIPIEYYLPYPDWLLFACLSDDELYIAQHLVLKYIRQSTLSDTNHYKHCQPIYYGSAQENSFFHE